MIDLLVLECGCHYSVPYDFGLDIIMRIFVLFAVVTIHLAVRQVLGAYPFERDVSRITGLHPPKKWLVFMETRIQRCVRFNQLSAKYERDLISLFRCLSTHYKRPNRCYYFRTKHDRYSIISLGMLQFKQLGSAGLQNCQYMTKTNVHLVVHNLFHINFTVASFAKPIYHRRVYSGRCYSDDAKLIVYFNIHFEEICGTRYPWSIYIPFNQARVRIRVTGNIPFESIIGEMEVMDRQFILRLRGSHIEDIISMRHFHVQKKFITVEMLFQIHLSTKTGPKVIIYDGPRLHMPKLSPYENLFNKSHYVSSTFQVVVVYVFSDDNFISELKYNKDDNFIPRKLFPPKQIILSNNSGCGNVSILSWMCTFHIISLRETQASVQIMQLDIAGPYADTHMSAGVAIYNVINNTAYLVVHLFYNYNLEHTQTPLSVTGSTNELYISVYAYSPYTLLSLKFIAQINPCIGIFIGKNVRPSLVEVPHYIEKGYIGNQFFVNFHITLNISGQCYIIHVDFFHTESTHFQYNVVSHYEKCNFLRLHYNRYGADLHQLRFWVSGKFQLIGGGYHFPFHKVFGDICRFTIQLLAPSMATVFVATVEVTQMGCLQPCRDTDIIISNGGRHLEMCDMCKYTWLDNSMNDKEFVSNPNGFISLEHIRGNQPLIIWLRTISTIISGGHGITYSIQPFTFHYPRPRLFKTVIEKGERWRIRRESLLSDAVNSIHRRAPRMNNYKLRKGGYEYISVLIPTDYGNQPTRIKDWIFYDTQCSKYGATFLTIQDYQELRFIITSIMQPHLMERIYISKSYLYKV